ncbi:hypothetical protein F511_19327 [Dorcoceras hygrometricum]|uniref:Uncharacterized protein n=1 Tax=Dorcoceras hygrometricum TaxID=472368 RepID=A0A2Z7CI52_9LAMI|nr:hypothetical protein F511_19327 [Dorcoceras hygrometricum]
MSSLKNHQPDSIETLKSEIRSHQGTLPARTPAVTRVCKPSTMHCSLCIALYLQIYQPAGNGAKLVNKLKASKRLKCRKEQNKLSCRQKEAQMQNSSRKAGEEESLERIKAKTSSKYRTTELLKYRLEMKSN